MRFSVCSMFKAIALNYFCSVKNTLPENFVTLGMCCIVGVCENRDLNLLLHDIGYLDRLNLNR
ncbi:hypothetical protein [Nostoc sp. LPT]|uniref:hypothetical protein n=1 Tax=Nostoc sp. LPT TaxID=2815387 RepID=UPI001DFCB301|nr:hypothetical protein [Nostoc sp. LPT]MBN4002361.1 hypothetical protein [Nostoc sp. LPT]